MDKDEMEERDDAELRRLLVAFHDATTWCEQLRGLASQFVKAAQGGAPPTRREIADAIQTLSEAERYLATATQAVNHLRRRVGLPPSDEGERP